MRFGKLALVFTVALLVAGTVTAQQPRPGGFGGFGGFGGGLSAMIAQNKQLQEELKVDKDQIEKLTAAFAKVREDMKDELAKLRDRNTAQEDRTEITKKLGEANNKAVASILKAEQIKRLHQIENQQAGLGMYAKEEVQKSLKLTDDQKEKITTLNKDLQKDMRELFVPGQRPDADAGKKREALQKEAKDNIQKILTDAQKTAVKDLTGEPFTLQFQGFGAPGGAGGFGGGGFGGGRSQPGQILSSGVQDTLKLTAEQKKQLEDMQKELDAKLGKLLTEEQKKQLKEMQDRAPGAGRRPGGANPPQ